MDQETTCQITLTFKGTRNSIPEVDIVGEIPPRAMVNSQYALRKAIPAYGRGMDRLRRQERQEAERKAKLEAESKTEDTAETTTIETDINQQPPPQHPGDFNPLAGIAPEEPSKDEEAILTLEDEDKEDATEGQEGTAGDVERPGSDKGAPEQ